jgi:hypothetical protein
MGKSSSRQNAAEYRLMAEIARCEKQRSQLLQFANEWRALAHPAAGRSKRRTYCSALNPVTANHPESAAA